MSEAKSNISVPADQMVILPLNVFLAMARAYFAAPMTGRAESPAPEVEELDPEFVAKAKAYGDMLNHTFVAQTDPGSPSPFPRRHVEENEE